MSLHVDKYELDTAARRRRERQTRNSRAMRPRMKRPSSGFSNNNVSSGVQFSEKEKTVPIFAVNPVYSPGERPQYTRTPEMRYSYGSNLNRARTDPNTERLIAHRATQSSQWRIHWRVPGMIVFSLFMGVVFASLQHFLYRWLHHRVMNSEQEKFHVVLYGRALAFFAKVAFGGTVVLVFRQRMWRTFRHHALSVLTIDQLFSATEYPTLFSNSQAWVSAPHLVMMAAVIWIIPIATIVFSPGALTFGNFIEHRSHLQIVPTLDFMAETDKDWRYPVPIGDGSTTQKSLIYYNTTDVQAATPGWFDYYDQPSAELKRIALLMAYSNNNYPNVKQTGRQDVCGGELNCTYEQSFVAPGYKCEEVTDLSLQDIGAPFNISVLIPEGRNVYYAEVDLGEYLQPQKAEFQSGPGGIPVGDPPADLGVFKSEPVLWIGYAVNSTVRLPADDPLTLNWTHRYEPHIIRCTHMETRYTVHWNWTEPLFKATITRTQLTPILNTTLTPTSDPTPQSNYISPRTNPSLYKKVATYHAVGSVFRAFLRGTVTLKPPKPGPSYAQVYSDITKTRLVQPNAHPKANLTQELESFYTDLVLSLFSLPSLLVITNETTLVNITQRHSSFIYVPLRLWQCYAPVTFVALLIAAFGAFTIWQDGTTFSTGFSRILVTTRNSTLDEVSRGACLGNDPFPQELMHAKLKFGVIGGGAGDGVGHCAFGVEAEVGRIERGVLYAGLRNRIGSVVDDA